MPENRLQEDLNVYACPFEELLRSLLKYDATQRRDELLNKKCFEKNQHPDNPQSHKRFQQTPNYSEEHNPSCETPQIIYSLDGLHLKSSSLGYFIIQQKPMAIKYLKNGQLFLFSSVNHLSGL